MTVVVTNLFKPFFPFIITSIHLLSYTSLRVTLKIVNAVLKAKAKAWTFKAKAIGPKAKAKAIKFGLKAKAWPQGLHHWLHLHVCLIRRFAQIICISQKALFVYLLGSKPIPPRITISLYIYNIYTLNQSKNWTATINVYNFNSQSDTVKFLNWLRTSCVSSITTTVAMDTPEQCISGMNSHNELRIDGATNEWQSDCGPVSRTKDCTLNTGCNFWQLLIDAVAAAATHRNAGLCSQHVQFQHVRFKGNRQTGAWDFRKLGLVSV